MQLIPLSWLCRTKAGENWWDRAGWSGVMFSKASVLLRILFLHWLMDEKIKSPLPVTNVQSIQMLVKKWVSDQVDYLLILQWSSLFLPLKLKQINKWVILRMAFRSQRLLTNWEFNLVPFTGHLLLACLSQAGYGILVCNYFFEIGLSIFNLCSLLMVLSK